MSFGKNNRVLPYIAGLGPSRLSVWMERIRPCSKELAWCHTTDAYALRDIISAGRFSPQRCDVFGEPLSYLFYGRPAYPVGQNASMRTTARAPVVIMLSSDVLEARKRMFPFDTGAFARGRYSTWIHKSMPLCDFELTHLLDAPRRYVPCFYGTNQDYLRLKPRPPPISYAGAFEVEAMVSLLGDMDASSADDRRHALELQIDEPLPFRSPLVRALILPRDLKSAPYLSSFLSGPGRDIEIQWFDLSPIKIAKDYKTLLEAHALRIQQRWRLL